MASTGRQARLAVMAVSSALMAGGGVGAAGSAGAITHGSSQASSTGDPTSDDFPHQDGLFTSGQAAMTITGPWLVASSKSLSFGVAPIPAGTTASTLGVADAWATFRGAKASPAAISSVLTYLMSPAN